MSSIEEVLINAVSANAKILILKLITTPFQFELEGSQLCLLMQRY